MSPFGCCSFHLITVLVILLLVLFPRPTFSSSKPKHWKSHSAHRAPHSNSAPATDAADSVPADASMDETVPEPLTSSDVGDVSQVIPVSDTMPPPVPQFIKCQIVSPSTVRCGRTLYDSEYFIPPRKAMFWVYAACCAALVLLAGLISGLTLGLLSLDQTNLEVIKRSGKKKDREKAAAILPLVKRHHLLLVTLILINASANEALPLFLNNLVPPDVNIVLSVTLVLFFGEIIPQAVCTKHSLSIGAACAPLVWVLMFITSPISYPLSRILDRLLGVDHGTFYQRAELRELVQMMHRGNSSDGVGKTDPNKVSPDNAPSPLILDSPQPGLTFDECTIIRGAIDMTQKTAGQCMTPIAKVEMVDFNGFLNRTAMQKLHDRGHSRIPVFMGTPDHVVGMLLVKHLMMVNPDQGIAVRDLKLRPVPFVPADKPLYDMLNLFQRGRSHMAMVVDAKDHITLAGILTLEDVIEELIQEEIQDETDIRRIVSRQPSSAAFSTGSGSGASHPVLLLPPVSPLLTKPLGPTTTGTPNYGTMAATASSATATLSPPSK